jgi:hypothetical protein
VPFGLIRNGPISSDAPYATEEHPGPGSNDFHKVDEQEMFHLIPA